MRPFQRPALLAALLGKPAHARTAAHSRHLEILITRPGHQVHHLRIDLDTLRRVALWAVAAVALWLAITVFMAWGQIASSGDQRRAQRLAAQAAATWEDNARLQAENGAMANTLLALKQRVDGLASTLHGFVQKRAEQFPVEAKSGSQGGIAEPLSAANAPALLGEEADLITSRLNLLLPQARYLASLEAARPMGEPVAGNVAITSDYGLRPNPMGGGVEFHNGIDFGVNVGTAVHATAHGVVASAGWKAGYGDCVVIDHPFGYRSLFGHLSKILVKPGDAVTRGQIIALSGNTGRSTGPHLHYTLFYGTKTLDPATYLLANR
ncbi:M23 family metallopeptidase [Thiomonas intermedia]|uniref:M23 family metallopeptidase n=1 Tax=Thiomonas intermedia TaxID=926 RepID=UPI0009A47C6C|nr:M23 family metallopeptidase [Thiomonas intermedia]